MSIRYVETNTVFLLMFIALPYTFTELVFYNQQGNAYHINRLHAANSVLHFHTFWWLCSPA